MSAPQTNGAPPPASSEKQRTRVRMRAADDYEASAAAEATEPSFEVDYADGGAAARADMLRKNPLVPVGALCTAAILGGGLFAFNRGNALWSQRLMRARVVSQAATLGILSLSVYQYKATPALDV